MSAIEQNSWARPQRRAFLFGAAAACVAPLYAKAAPASRLIDEKWRRTGSLADPDARPWADFLGQWTSLSADGVARVDYAGALQAGARAPLSVWHSGKSQQLSSRMCPEHTPFMHWRAWRR